MRDTDVTTNKVRLSYVHLAAPYSNDPDTAPKFSTTVLVSKSDTASIQRIKAAIAAAKASGVAKKWGGRVPAVLNLPVYDGDGVRPNGESFDDACKGCYVFTASSGSERPPQVVDSALNPIINKNTVYSGCYARVNVSFFPYDSKGRRGIGCGLNAVQFVADGEPLGTTVSVADAFGAPDTDIAAGAPDTGIAAGEPANTVTGAPQIDPLTGMPYGV